MDIKSLWSKLEGKKTYLVAVCIGVLAAVKYLGLVDDETYQTLMVVLAGGGLAALRAAK